MENVPEIRSWGPLIERNGKQYPQPKRAGETFNGFISMLANGIEPIFANYYEKKTESLHGKDVKYKVYTPIVREYMEAHNITDDSDLPSYFITSENLNHLKRIRCKPLGRSL